MNKMNTALLVVFCLLSNFLSAQTSFDLALDHLQNTGKYTNTDLSDMVISDEYLSADMGITHLYLKQRYQGIELYGTLSNFNIKNAEMLSIGDKFFASIDQKINTVEAQISATEALQKVMAAHTMTGVTPAIMESAASGDRKTTFEKGTIAQSNITAKLVFLNDNEVLKLCWEVNVYEKSCDAAWETLVDASTGEILKEHNHVLHCSFHAHKKEELNTFELAEITLKKNAMVVANSYNVFNFPTESPNHGNRTLVTDPWNNGGQASTLGWHDDGTDTYTHTKGNNADAYHDQDGTNSPTGGDDARADGGNDLEFDFPLDLSQDPNLDPDPYITNLFYWNNLMHDVWYQYGFDEASGNFQEDNLGRGGLGGDYVNAEAQDGIGSNNATFFTPVDGSNPRMQMYLWTPNDNSDPELDSSLDNGVVAHEYGHGISNRLTGGPSNVSCLSNAEQMGEGWSDFFGLWMTIEQGDNHADSRGVGTYVEDEDPDGDGIRPAPYTTDMDVNDYTYGNTNDSDVSRPHGIGFIWCTMIWDLNWAFVNVTGLDTDVYNGTGGNNYAARIIIAAMKLQECSPGFVDGRDAILEANSNSGGIAFTNVIWNVFARRGLGFSALQGSSANRFDQTEAFDLPPDVPFMTYEELFGALPLPVEMTMFNAVADDKDQEIDVYWSTATEVNNSGFDLQRRAEREEAFQSIAWMDGRVESNSFSNYNYIDEKVEAGVEYYYRLRQVDIDGKENYSEIVTAKLNTGAFAVEVFPNPTRGLSTVKFSDSVRGQIDMQILNAQGQVIGVQLFETNGNAELEVDLSKQPEGVYFLKFEKENDTVIKQVIVKK